MSKPIRQIRIEGNIAYVPLTQGYEAVIDAEDAHLVCGCNWHVKIKRWTSYAIGTVKDENAWQGRRLISMHRLLTSAAKNEQVDHADRDGLNNRKSNLRICSAEQNQQNRGISVRNSSGYKGVNFDRAHGKWQVRVTHFGNRSFVGYFDTPEEAGAAYAVAARKLHGEFCHAGLVALEAYERGPAPNLTEGEG